MKKLILVAIYVAAPCALFAQKVDVPFFGKMTSSELSGMDTYSPSNSSTAAPVTDALYFDGDVNSILGRYFSKSVFDTSPCDSRAITANDTSVVHTNVVFGKLTDDKKNTFDLKVTADLVELLRNNIELPDSLKAKLIVQLKNTVRKQTEDKIKLKFEIIQLKMPYVDTEVKKCLEKLKKNDAVIVGVSTLTVSGEWSSTTIKTALDEFELKVGLSDKLSAEALLGYQRSKDRVLTGKYKKFSIIISTAYKIK